MNRLRKTAFDYAIVAVSPALIMALVGSLVWFLLAVVYQGHLDGKLRFVFFAFVFAAVLISRISIEAGRARAAMYGAALGTVTWLALARFVEIDGVAAGVSALINLALLSLIWWSISRLTWDCTFLDESKDTSGQGLLNTMGLDQAAKKANGQTRSIPATEPVTWRQRLGRRRPHAHGLWVVYFSLAALPLFGIGQALLPAGSGSDFFWLMFVYLASAFGLLVTTSLLGLRKYLRQRKIQMPADIAGSWLAKGAVLTLLLLMVVWLLPRPGHALWSPELPFHLGSSDELETSQLAPGDEGQTDVESADRTVDEENGGQGESADAAESSGNDQGDADQGPPGDDSKDGSPGDSEGSESDDAGSANQTDTSSSAASKVVGSIGNLLKWVFILVMIAIGAIVAWRFRHQIVAGWRQFLDELREFWQRLLGRRKAKASVALSAESPTSLKSQVPFTAFTDPFSSGTAGKYTPESLVIYTFQAFEAWARENDCRRESEQTPHEFARHAGLSHVRILEGAENLANLYCQAAFAETNVTPADAKSLATFWRHLTRLHASIRTASQKRNGCGLS